MTRPTFVVIGAARAGTTTLHHALAGHPQVGMAEPKEPNHFCRHSRLPLAALARTARTLAEYQRRFGPEGRLAYGDASPAYLDPVHAEHAAETMHAHNPDMRIVAVLRSPIEQLWSCWTAIGGHRNALGFADHARQHLADCRRGLMPHLERFGREQVLVLVFEDLVDPRKEADISVELCAHVGVHPAHLSFARRNESGRMPPGVDGMIRRGREALTWAEQRGIISRDVVQEMAEVGGRVRRLLRWPAPRLPDSVRYALTSDQKREAEAIADLLGWPEVPPQWLTA